tara:strand:- start:3006 stop:3956 length:951 start_codon:yes stop_codon:yes gene_type:complete
MDTAVGKVVSISLLVIFAVMPVLAPLVGEPYYVDVFARIMLWAMAALGLNLILGFGGMVSFGHAAYVGVGAYTVGILSHHGVSSGFLQWPLAIGLSGIFAAIFGAISLRTRGIYFIMITLAFSQMLYFLAVSLEQYGSNDGLLVPERSDFSIGTLHAGIDDDHAIYYVILCILVLCLYAKSRLIAGRFGMILKGIKSNETRLQALGVSTYRYRLAAFTLSGMICGLSGVLFANFEGFVSPDLMHWTRSGEVLIMVILGGAGMLFGPLFGATVFLLLSEVLARFTDYWNIIFGPILILVVLYAKGGIGGLFRGRNRG